MIIRQMITVLALGTLFTGPVLAQGPGAGGRQASPEQREARFMAADANKDGKLSKDEWITVLPEQAKAMADQMWSSRVDADGDGFITKEQFLAMRMGGGGRGGQ